MTIGEALSKAKCSGGKITRASNLRGEGKFISADDRRAFLVPIQKKGEEKWCPTAIDLEADDWILVPEED